ncbi:GntR family transcriptional regulator [Arthrobacter sp. Marseille-P9274]|uniref:GntR family transcriptional regulator n=1 Tax=Arthrobacter sp. Marseille-P9274 TaxID=2866572 RepID=UPI0021CA9E5C|nr:GntR family transcriptional regulator [Arthrobacter sp. Marseille-P9274]
MLRLIYPGEEPESGPLDRGKGPALLTVYPRRGTIIADVNIRDLKAISDARRVLEGFAARRAAELATDEDRQRLKECLRALAEAPAESNQTSMDLDERIHLMVYAVMRNSYVEATLVQYFSLSQRMWNFVLSGLAPITGNVREHEALLQAIIDGDADRAAALAEEHVTHFEGLVRNAL